MFADLGCGRGELSYQAARKGAEVIAVDYSEDAIRLCRETFSGEEELQGRVSFLCSDVSRLLFSRPLDRVVAADLVEHLAPDELDRLFALIARSLAPGGRLIVHTFPNLWHYRRGYPKQRRASLARGEYLPPDPRSVYEKLMHINEQSPAGLKRSLKDHFSHVWVWLYEREEESAGSLVRRYGLEQCKRSRGIYAVAAHDPLDPEELKSLLVQNPLTPEGMNVALKFAQRPPERVRSGSWTRVSVFLSNRGNRVLSSFPPAPVHFSYHWKSLEGKGENLYDGKRTGLPFPVLPNEELSFEIQVATPEKPGVYVLPLTLVQEGVAWFEQHCHALPLECRLSVES